MILFVNLSLFFLTEEKTAQYVGDLGSIQSKNGNVVFIKEKAEIKLAGPEDRSVLDRTLIIHSEPTGGDIIMCCAIKAP